MFVRHITEKDVFEKGFILNPLTNETFSKQKIDTQYLSTYMQIWVDINSYRYRVVTDREGLVENGIILSKDILSELHAEFFDNDIDSFLKRNIPKKFSHWSDIKLTCMMGNIDRLDHNTKQQKMIELFGEL